MTWSFKHGLEFELPASMTGPSPRAGPRCPARSPQLNVAHPITPAPPPPNRGIRQAGQAPHPHTSMVQLAASVFDVANWPLLAKTPTVFRALAAKRTAKLCASAIRLATRGMYSVRAFQLTSRVPMLPIPGDCLQTHEGGAVAATRYYLPVLFTSLYQRLLPSLRPQPFVLA